MTDPQTIVRRSLEGIGLGPSRIESALAGAELFGPAGLLNSLELVQLITALSESTEEDGLDFLELVGTCVDSVFRDVGALCGFLAGHLAAEQEA